MDTSPNLNNFEVDAESANTAAFLNSTVVEPPADDCIYSRVLKDPWHLMHMLILPANHGLRRAFSNAFRDIIFVPDPEDYRHIAIYAEKNSMCSILEDPLKGI